MWGLACSRGPLLREIKFIELPLREKKGGLDDHFALLDGRVLMAHHVKNPGRWPHRGVGPLGSWSEVGLDQSRDPFWLEKMRALDPFCVEW